MLYSGTGIIEFPLSGELSTEGPEVLVTAFYRSSLKVLENQNSCRARLLGDLGLEQPKSGDEHGTLNGGVPGEQVLKTVYGRRGMEINGVQSPGEVTQETNSLGVPSLIIPFPDGEEVPH